MSGIIGKLRAGITKNFHKASIKRVFDSLEPHEVRAMPSAFNGLIESVNNVMTSFNDIPDTGLKSSLSFIVYAKYLAHLAKESSPNVLDIVDLMRSGARELLGAVETPASDPVARETYARHLKELEARCAETGAIANRMTRNMRMQVRPLLDIGYPAQRTISLIAMPAIMMSQGMFKPAAVEAEAMAP